MITDYKEYENSVIQRVNIIIDKYNITQKQISDTLGLSQSTISQYLRGKIILPLNLIVHLLKTYPQISTDWLLFGEGEMEVDRISIERLNEIIEEKNAKIEAQQHQIGQLEKRIDTILNNLK